MDFELSKRDYSIILLVVVVLVGLDVVLYMTIHNKKIVSSIAKNDYNVYNSSYITADKQASIYLSNYYNLIYIDVEKAYAKFEKDSMKQLYTIEEFKSYVSKMDLSSTKVTKLNYYKKGKYTYYSIIDGNNNRLTFKSMGVINYIVDFR